MRHTVRIQENNPQKISFYFRSEWRLLLIVTISGLIYNLGLLAGPWFEGQMAQCLVDLAGHRSSFSDMAGLVLCYLAAIAIVQGSRFLKRLYVRHFANNISRRMKENLYANLIHKSRAELSVENAGTLLTKAISDADACAEGTCCWARRCWRFWCCWWQTFLARGGSFPFRRTTLTIGVR